MLNRLSPGSQTYKLKRFFFIFMPDCSLKNCFRIRRKRLLEKKSPNRVLAHMACPLSIFTYIPKYSLYLIFYMFIPYCFCEKFLFISVADCVLKKFRRYLFFNICLDPLSNFFYHRDFVSSDFNWSGILKVLCFHSGILLHPVLN